MKKPQRGLDTGEEISTLDSTEVKKLNLDLTQVKKTWRRLNSSEEN